MQTNDRVFWMRLVDALNGSSERGGALDEALRDVCVFFEFGYGFIYRADYTGALHLTESFSSTAAPLPPETLDPATLLPGPLLAELAGSKAVSFRGGSEKDELAGALAGLFGARSLALVPVADSGGALLALVGIGDRRGEQRVRGDAREDGDMSLAYSALATLATYVKMLLYQSRAETTRRALESTLDNMGVDVYVSDFSTQEILYVNRSMARPYGGAVNMLGKKCWQVLYDNKEGICEYCPCTRLLDENGKPTKLYSWNYQRPFDGTWFRVLSAAFPWVDGRLAQVISSVDITENKRNEEIIRRLAEYDHLTGLPNRYKLTVDCERGVERLVRDGVEGFVLFLDLDGFKRVNDRLGHRAGDELLIRTGRLLLGSPLTRARSYRYGGDEFVVLFPADAGGSVWDVIELLRESFSAPFALEEGEVCCRASVGISHFPYDSASATGLLRMADRAMYAAKSGGSGEVRFWNRGAPCAPPDYGQAAGGGGGP